MHSSSLSVAILALVVQVTAFWRMPARGISGIARIDPIVSPGEVSNHAHIVFGGSGFGMNANYDSLSNSNCTSNGVLEDKSAYWTPVLYFQYANGTFEMVNNVGGMLAYYQLNMDNLTAFPEGFQMVAGSPWYRNFTGPFPDTGLSSWPTNPSDLDQFFLQQRALGFNCLNYNAAPEPSLYRHQFPAKSFMDSQCTDGLRLEMAFPSCGTGALSSPEQTHVAYPSLVKEGVCPDGYDVHYPFLFYETIWATNEYAGVDGNFVLSTGDPGDASTQSGGSSYHGDFIMGWKSADFLQQAVDTCTNLSGDIQDCPLFTIQDDGDAEKCKFPMPDQLADEDTAGPRSDLPVNVPIQSGPEQATKYAVPGQSSAGSSSPATTTAETPSQPSLSIPTPTEAAPTPPAMKNAVVSEVTSAAVLPASSSAAGAIVATTYTTSGAEVIEIVVEEDVVTVTVSEPPLQKRHVHRHHRRPRHW